MIIFQILLKMKLINAVPLSVLIPRAEKGNWLISPPRLSTFYTALFSKWHGWKSTGYNHLWSSRSRQNPLSFSYRSERLCRHRNNLAFRCVFDKRAIEGDCLFEALAAGVFTPFPDALDYLLDWFGVKGVFISFYLPVSSFCAYFRPNPVVSQYWLSSWMRYARWGWVW